MESLFQAPRVTICVLTSGNYPDLIKRALTSILESTDRELFHLVVGANAVSADSASYLENLLARGSLDHLVRSENNLGKCPMMRRMFQHVQSEFVWWFDDDSYIIEKAALSERLRVAEASPPELVMWGERYCAENSVTFCHDDPVAFVRSAAWYRGLPPPFWKPGGKGEFNYDWRQSGDGRWIFLTGGGWFARFAALQALDWPDPRLRTFGEDVFLGEAIRQQGWQIQHIGKAGVEINAAPRRWSTDEERKLGGQPQPRV
jgi:GT2 family glycosyltransferase